MAKKKRLKIKARELTDINVDWISIVQEGANKIPFRILKSSNGDKTMINLSRLQKNAAKRTKKALKPLVYAIGIPNNANKALQDIVMKSGIKTDNKEHNRDSDTWVYYQNKSRPDDSLITLDLCAGVQAVVSCNESLISKAVEYTRESLDILNKASINGQSTGTDFISNMSRSGFIPGFYRGLEVLSRTMDNIAYLEDIQEAVSLATKATSDFANYVNELLANLPQELMVIERAINDMSGTLNVDSEDSGPNKQAEQAEQAEQANQDGQDGQDGQDMNSTNSNQLSDSDDEDTSNKEEFNQQADDNINDLLARFETMLDQKLSGFVGDLEAVSKQVEGLHETTEKLNKTVNNKVTTNITEQYSSPLHKQVKTNNSLFDDVLSFDGFNQ